MNVLDCEHCRALRAIVAASSERLGRPVDSYDAESYAIPFVRSRPKGAAWTPEHGVPLIDDVQACACTCHAHLAIVGRWTAPS